MLHLLPSPSQKCVMCLCCRRWCASGMFTWAPWSCMHAHPALRHDVSGSSGQSTATLILQHDLVCARLASRQLPSMRLASPVQRQILLELVHEWQAVSLALCGRGRCRLLCMIGGGGAASSRPALRGQKCAGGLWPPGSRHKLVRRLALGKLLLLRLSRVACLPTDAHAQLDAEARSEKRRGGCSCCLEVLL